ncbi:OsmC family protein [Acidimicrobiia bacterium EGI L10123]|uniref:OsmC family protein n=1 Tax=Salinilacustrithrix flava TaxID=2957203 RepID=UPI003D7C1CD7|nr:OsmC family protein [Acidimicrobiia bacterium EGI L10123]
MPPADTDRTYEAHAETNGSGVGEIHTRQSVVRFDSSPTQGDELPGPADLLTSAFAACIIKNVERMGELLPFAFDLASVEVTAERQDRPPKVVRLGYVVTVVTDEPPHRVDLLHRNIQRHGTIFNTLAEVCEVSGTIKALPSR